MLRQTYTYPIDRFVGMALRLLRKEKGLTLKDLESVSDRSHTYFAKIETYERRITYGELIDICNWLDLEPMSIYSLAHKLESLSND